MRVRHLIRTSLSTLTGPTPTATHLLTTRAASPIAQIVAMIVAIVVPILVFCIFIGWLLCWYGRHGRSREYHHRRSAVIPPDLGSDPETASDSTQPIPLAARSNSRLMRSRSTGDYARNAGARLARTSAAVNYDEFLEIMTPGPALIGGSLAGLMHGIMLHRHGYSVTILEQEPASIREGFDAGIRAGPDVVAFMDRYDRAKRPYGIYASGSQFINRAGTRGRKVLGPMTLSSWGLLMSILRANFDGTTSKAVPRAPDRGEWLKGAVYRNGVCVKSVEDLGEKVKVYFKDAVSRILEFIEADLVVVADGSNSQMRKQLIPDFPPRQYAGYTSWRGTVPEKSIEERYRQVFEGHVAFHLMNRSYILVYLIPTDDGNLEPGERLYNWVWYDQLPEASASETMTDIHGKLHYGTVPRGLVRPEIWRKQRERALQVSKMPACIATLIENTPSPFLTKIYDTASSKAVFFGEKLFLAGDALVAFRPHIALSTNQAAYHSELLEKVVEGKMTPKEWERAVLRYGYSNRMFSVLVGTFGTGTRLALVWVLCRYILLLVRQKFGFLS
ncbi:hypothetical protein BCR34DRAFT_595771 [Clohesyomyces aquaticus]|uniref:2,6-dihydroxypyridine 3-monooxygenase substrate binding domain-containing protein n=1 Tax=Clohesyomyces aquaticus TaxID=1231657 RepID=A0A1Y2A8U6_9PLEO|nr:hypothetical protein BCR34DRAFT_595771 [Clohesyomyces aquaticus]